MSFEPFILLDDLLAGTCRTYRNPIKVVTVRKAHEVQAALEELEGHLASGKFVAGFMSYEAGFAMEPKLLPLLDPEYDFPLLQMGVFEEWSPEYPEVPGEAAPALDLKPFWDESAYLKRFEKVIDYIKAGDVYQINLTFPLSSEYTGSAKCCGPWNRPKARSSFTR